jgi:hypothetical protein
MRSACGRCAVGLACLAGRLRPKLYCAKCHRIELEGSLPNTYRYIDCPYPPPLHLQMTTTLSVCAHCEFQRRKELRDRLAQIRGRMLGR